jgi:hypothetical protein
MNGDVGSFVITTDGKKTIDSNRYIFQGKKCQT